MVIEQHGQLGWIRAKARSEEMSRRECEQQAENAQAELEQARERIDELMGQEGRMEEELAGRIEVLDKLRNTVREMEKDKRETGKRYREQAESFDSERQSWYDQEQHYKTRISNLSTTTRKARLSVTQIPKQVDPRSSQPSSDSESDQQPGRPNPRQSLSSSSIRSGTASPTPSAGAGPSANELALQEQLATLSTAHSSLTNTLRALQIELSDLKRVYQDLQEENESYEVLLGERTLNGEVRGTDLFRRSFQWGEGGTGETPTAAGFGFTGGLEAVGEEAEELSSESDSDDGDVREADEMDEDDVERVLLESQGTGTPNSGAVLSRKATTRRRRSSARHGREASAASSAGGGGGMDLAAELEMADVDEGDEQRIERRKAKRERKAAQAAANGDRRGSIMTVGLGEDLRSEVRQLREANKALTLYVSKIVDRVCSQEGFEKVLAVDYRLATPKTPAAPADPDPEVKKSRPSSGFFGLGGSSSTPAVPAPPLTPAQAKKEATPNPSLSEPVGTPSTRKGISWEGVTSAFSNVLSRSNTVSTSSPATNPHMKPLRLGESINARKLELDEDDDDIRARMRLHREMAELGIDGNDGGNQWGHRSSLSAADFAPRDLDAELSEQNAPMAAKLALHANKVKESDAKQELEAGRASGFTDAPRRRRPGSMRSANSSSRNSVNLSVMGLGISDPAQGGDAITSSSTSTTPELTAGALGPAFSPSPSRGKTPSPHLGAPEMAQMEGASPTWQKMAGGFKRLSRGLSLSGAPGQAPVPTVAREPATPEEDPQ